jgi:hypothetical protein
LQLNGKRQLAKFAPSQPAYRKAHDPAPIVRRSLKRHASSHALVFIPLVIESSPTMSQEKVVDHATSISSGGVGETSHKRDTDTGFLGKLRAFEATMDARLGIESDAISRKLPEDKGHVPWHQQMNMFFLWASGTMNTSCFATGFLGWEFGLSKLLCAE